MVFPVLWCSFINVNYYNNPSETTKLQLERIIYTQTLFWTISVSIGSGLHLVLKRVKNTHIKFWELGHLDINDMWWGPRFRWLVGTPISRSFWKILKNIKKNACWRSNRTCKGQRCMAYACSSIPMIVLPLLSHVS